MTGDSNAAGRHMARVRVSKAHPALPGHFPGEPVVPGVVLLDLVIEAAERRLGRPLGIAGLLQVKFPSPLLPEEEARVSFRVDEGTRLAFEVERDGRLIARGAFKLSAHGSTPAAGAARPEGCGA